MESGCVIFAAVCSNSKLVQIYFSNSYHGQTLSCIKISLSSVFIHRDSRCSISLFEATRSYRHFLAQFCIQKCEMLVGKIKAKGTGLHLIRASPQFMKSIFVLACKTFTVNNLNFVMYDFESSGFYYFIILIECYLWDSHNPSKCQLHKREKLDGRRAYSNKIIRG